MTVRCVTEPPIRAVIYCVWGSAACTAPYASQEVLPRKELER
jgi:hypothetical protein